jgi:outer membrane protein assembly factor BamD (BamD/ComL family)
MLAKALFNLAEYTETLKITKEFGRRFPQSRYAAAVGILAGDALFISKRFYEAGDAYASVLLLEETTFPQVQAAERLAGIVKKNLINTQGLARIKQVLGADQLDEALLFAIA